MKNNIVIIILTFNSEKVIKETVLAAKKISKNIVVLDSYSTDNTIKIVKKLLKYPKLPYGNSQGCVP